MNQVLTGHCGYRKYLYSLGFEEWPDCSTCEGVAEDAQAVFSTYPKFENSRRNLESELNAHLTVENLVRNVVQPNTVWDAVVVMVKRIQQRLKE